MPKDKTTKTKVILSALIWHEDMLLLLQRRRNFSELDYGSGLWELPGGKPEFGEHPGEALQREVGEETGISPAMLESIPRITDAFAYVLEADDTKSHRIHFVYSLVLEKMLDIRLSDEHKAHRFYKDIEELSGLEMIPEVRDFVMKKFK